MLLRPTAPPPSNTAVPAAEGAAPAAGGQAPGAAEAATGGGAAPASASCTPYGDLVATAPGLGYSAEDFGGWKLPPVPPRNDSTLLVPTPAAFKAFFASLSPGSQAALSSNPQAVLALMAFTTGAGCPHGPLP